MTKRSILAALVFFVIGPSLFADALWDQAGRRFAENANWLAGTMRIQAVQTNGAGEVMTEEFSHIRLQPRSDGTVNTFVVRATKDGEDITAERREGAQGLADTILAGDGDNPFADFNRSPFSPQEQANVSFRRTDRMRREGGEFLRAYAFVHNLGPNERTIGTAWLSETTGAPRIVEFTVDPRPALVNEVLVRLRYALQPNGDMYVDHATVTAVGQFLFIIRRFELEMSFDDHARTDIFD